MEVELTSSVKIKQYKLYKNSNVCIAIFSSKDGMVCNKILIENGKGMMSIPVKLDGEFKTMLVKYYEMF